MPLLEETRGRHEADFRETLEAAPLKVGPKQPARGGTGFHEGDLLGSSAQGLDPDVAGSREEIEKAGAGYPRSEERRVGKECRL